MTMRFQKIKLLNFFWVRKKFDFFSQSHFLREIHFFKNEILDVGEIFGGGIFFRFFSFHSKKYFFLELDFFLEIQFRCRISPSSDFWRFQSDSGAPSWFLEPLLIRTRPRQPRVANFVLWGFHQSQSVLSTANTSFIAKFDIHTWKFLR